MSENTENTENEFMTVLLEKFKKSIGDFGSATPDDYYQTFLNMAIYDLESDDISEDVLHGDLGIVTIVLYAEALMNKTDIATNPTITLLRNKLSIMTKGARNVHE